MHLQRKKLTILQVGHFLKRIDYSFGMQRYRYGPAVDIPAAGAPAPARRRNVQCLLQNGTKPLITAQIPHKLYQEYARGIHH